MIISGAWKTKEDIANNFAIDISELNKYNLIYADYESGGWEGRASVLLEKGGILYEVNASHCSCYGLGGQFQPEETTKEALVLRSGYREFPKTVLNLL
jgi:hypothetical protein